MFGEKNHRFFDPNIFYVDDELRKVAELLVGGFIFTGQERPTGQRGHMREDLLKKFVTGEGVAGRLPYSILTKMYSIIGWKGLALNKFLQFDGITERGRYPNCMRSFESAVGPRRV